MKLFSRACYPPRTKTPRVHQDDELPLHYRRAQSKLLNSLPSEETEHSLAVYNRRCTELVHEEVNEGRRRVPRNLACVHVRCTKFIAKPATRKASRISKLYTTATPTWCSVANLHSRHDTVAGGLPGLHTCTYICRVATYIHAIVS